MRRKLGFHKLGMLLAATFALAAAGLLSSDASAITFMPDRQDAQRLSFPVASPSFVMAAGDTIADRVLGQMDFVHATENFANASTLDLSRSFAGVAIDQSSVPNRVYVADFANSRVLRWANASALTNGAPANIVIGQPDFFSTTCNNGGVSASSLCGQVSLAVDGSGNLYVADSENSRVLEYNTPFTNTGQPGSGDKIADQVFGQEGNFTTSACNQGAGKLANSTTLCRRAGIAIDSTGVLYIADEVNNRVLEYAFPLLDATANDLFGQAGQFSTTVCNKGGRSADSLCDPIVLATDPSDNLYIADDGNSRVLEYNNPPDPANDTTADRVFGQAGNFTTALCNGGGPNPGVATLCGPDGVGLDAAGHLYVTDATNSRVLEYTTPMTSTSANRVFGQGGNMNGMACNFTGNTDAAGLCRPGGPGTGQQREFVCRRR
jgi:sugar lactone lactonase YvrE